MSFISEPASEAVSHPGKPLGEHGLPSWAECLGWGHLGGRAANGLWVGSAAVHTRVLTVVAIVRAPVVLAAAPQGRFRPSTRNVVQPDGPSAWTQEKQGGRGAWD